LLISADFLASKFIRENELPPLLRAAEEEGTVILPIIVGPSLFLRNTSLAQFQAVNDASRPLVSCAIGEQESTFLKVAETILERANSRPKPFTSSVGEDFLDTATWDRLIKLGDWIFDQDKKMIIGSGVHAYLVSRNDYGETSFRIDARLAFSNFSARSGTKLPMNSGILFGFSFRQNGSLKYHNVLITGRELLIERVDYSLPPPDTAQHLTEGRPLEILANREYGFSLTSEERRVTLSVDGREYLTVERLPGILGRVGLRPWRSKLDCTQFAVRPLG
jgi:hypothetical protein